MEKTFWRKVRHRLKLKMNRKGQPSRQDRAFYHLQNYRSRTHYGTFHDKLRAARRTALENLKLLPKHSLIIPKVFCLIRDPDQTLKYIDDIKRKFKNNSTSCIIFIDHSQVEEYGLTASFLLDETLIEIKANAAKNGKNVYYTGRFKEGDKIAEFLEKFGILHSLKIADSDNMSWNYTNSDSFAIKVNSSKFNSEGIPSGVIEFSEYFNKCFKKNKHELTETGKNHFMRIFSEILNNAEEHCGVEVPEWSMLGYYDADAHQIQFAIMNIGNSIYETLKAKVAEKRKIFNFHYESFKKHENNFARLKGGINSQEHIWTLFALQDGVSCDKGGPGESRATRGQGMMDIIKLISDLKNDNDQDAVISLISGRTRIIVNNTYSIKVDKVDEVSEIRTISLNPENSLDYLPDPNNVMMINANFSGTIITGKFNINENFLEKK